MKLSDYLRPEDVHLELRAASKPELFRELGSLLGLEAETERAVLALLERREALGSTGIGRGIAVPHCRTSAASRLRVIYGRRPGGMDFGAIDGAPVEHFFVLIAPPAEVSDDYLPVLGRIARLAKEPDTPARLAAAATRDDLLAVLAAGDV